MSEFDRLDMAVGEPGIERIIALERVVNRRVFRPTMRTSKSSTTSQGTGRPSARVNNDNGSMMKTSNAWPGDWPASSTDWSEPTGEKEGTECAWKGLSYATRNTALPTPHAREPKNFTLEILRRVSSPTSSDKWEAASLVSQRYDQQFRIIHTLEKEYLELCWLPT